MSFLVASIYESSPITFLPLLLPTFFPFPLHLSRGTLFFNCCTEEKLNRLYGAHFAMYCRITSVCDGYCFKYPRKNSSATAHYNLDKEKELCQLSSLCDCYRRMLDATGFIMPSPSDFPGRFRRLKNARVNTNNNSLDEQCRT